MSDPHQTEQWPPRWDPPPLDTPRAGPGGPPPARPWVDVPQQRGPGAAVPPYGLPPQQPFGPPPPQATSGPTPYPPGPWNPAPGPWNAPPDAPGAWGPPPGAPGEWNGAPGAATQWNAPLDAPGQWGPPPDAPGQWGPPPDAPGRWGVPPEAPGGWGPLADPARAPGTGAPSGGRSDLGKVVFAALVAVAIGLVAILVIARPWASPVVDPMAAPIPTGTGPLPNPPGLPTTGGEPPVTDPGDALDAQVRADRAAVVGIPEGYWVPQLSSKRDGLVADGITYTEETILADHQDVRRRVPGAALLWSGDYSTFSGKDFWVTIVPAAAGDSPDAVNAWCDDRSFPADSCFAKRIGTSTYDRTTKHR